MAQKRKHPPDDTNSLSQSTDRSSSEVDTQIFLSSTIHDRSSTFTAAFSPSQHYLTQPKKLRLYEAFGSADHRMLAYRKRSNQQALSFTATLTAKAAAAGRPTYTTWSDDDDEKYAGKKLEKLLIDLNVEGVIVVARWWGGIMLGPVRFEHILNVAREAIMKWKAGDGGGDDRVEGRDAKKVKSDNDRDPVAVAASEAEEKQRLVRILGERDTSVNVLRGLLSDKGVELEKLVGATSDKSEVKSETVLQDNGIKASTTAGDDDGKKADKGEKLVSSPPQSTPNNLPVTPSTPSSKPDYSTMPLQRLKQLEKARDASIGWILKQIDGMEVKIKEAEKRFVASELRQFDTK